MSETVTIPEFDFAGFYYGEIVDSLLEYTSRNVPEISNRSPYEPAVQMLRAFALVGHLNNTLLDMVANEGTLPTARLRESVVRLLALIGYVPDANIPATGVLRLKLNKAYTTSTLIVTDNARFATRRRASTPSIIFESDASHTIDRTDELTAAWEYLAAGDTWTEYTTEVNTGSSTLTMWSNGGAGPAAGDAFYWCHANVMTDMLELAGITGTLADFGDDRPGTPLILVYEVSDGELEDAQPDSVTIDGSNLELAVDGLLGNPGESRAGLEVQVIYNATNTSQFCVVAWDGTVNSITTAGHMGQANPPSTTASDYTVGSYWHEVDGVVDNTKAVITVTGEAAGSGNGVLQTFSDTLSRWPLEADTVVTFTYPVSTVTKTATYDMSDGTLGGDADTGTTVDGDTGVFTLNTQSVPDSGASNVLVSYRRKAQPFQQDGDINFGVPMTQSQDWVTSALDDAINDEGTPPATEGFWLRARLVSLGDTPGTAGVTYDTAQWDANGLYIRVPVTQGRTYTGETAGSGNGTADQSCALSNSPVIEGSVDVTVDGDAWEQVDDFISSDSGDQHYIVRIDSDSVATVTFGDGVNGKVATSGTNNILATYRVGGSEDGNVGSGQITVNRTGLSRVRQVTNPRSCSGWVPQEGSGGDEALARLKRDGVADLRTLNRAVAPQDFEHLASRWTDTGFTEGVPFSRARAIENGYGPKTVRLVVVPVGGAVPSVPSTRARLETYFHGDTDSGGTTEGVGLVNTETTVDDYTPRTVTIVAEITGGDKDTVKAALASMVSPEALEGDGVTYRWKWGGNVTRGKLISLIFASDADITDVDLTAPAVNLTLADDELPNSGLADITITEA